jgi:hypothetical protein
MSKEQLNFCVRLGEWRLIYIRGPVVQLGPWRDGGYTTRWFKDFAILVRWWSFGRLFIERHMVVRPTEPTA